MTSVLALVLCLLFIAMLLALDRKRRRHSVSGATWLPTLMLMVLGSRPLSAWFDTSRGSTRDASPLDLAFFVFVVIASWIVASRRHLKWTTLLTTNTAITVCYLYLAITMLWSDDPLGSFNRWVKTFGLLAVVGLVLSERDPPRAIGAIYVRCACVLIPLSVLLRKYYPTLGRSYSPAGVPEYTGVALQKNSLGEIIMILLLFLIWDYLETTPAGTTGRWRLTSWDRAQLVIGATRRAMSWDRALLVLMGLWVLYNSDSKTAMICLPIGLALLVRGRHLASMTFNRVVLIGGLSLSFFLLFTAGFSSLAAPIVEVSGRDLTFTGRTAIWQAVLAQPVDPLLGVGYFNFWKSRHGEAVRRTLSYPGLGTSHNGYLEIFLDGGLIGLCLLLSLLLANGNRLAGRISINRYHSLRFAFLIVAIIYNLTEGVFFRLTPVWLTILLLSVDIDGRTADSRTVEQPLSESHQLRRPAPGPVRSRFGHDPAACRLNRMVRPETDPGVDRSAARESRECCGWSFEDWRESWSQRAAI
jgi:exopolysaccharide production protein ExoQ